MDLLPSSDPYEHIVQWYDLEHDPFQDDAECFVSLSESQGGSPVRVLEIGSGTGRLTAALALAGRHVTAVEPSPAMREGMRARLAQLPEKVARRIEIVEGSAVSFQLPVDARPFDVALLPQNVVAHLLTPSERELALAHVARWVRPGGQLLVDVDLAGPRRLHETAGQLWWSGTWRLRDGDGELTHFVSATPSRDPSLVHLLHFYDLSDPDGAVRRTTTRLSLALLQPGEVELAIRHAGFVVEETYGDYVCGPFDAAAPRIIVDARRAKTT